MWERAEERRTDLRSAHVVLENSTLTCQLRNLSSGGAAARLDRLVDLPASFPLRVIPFGGTHVVDLIWQDKFHFGVRFASAEG